MAGYWLIGKLNIASAPTIRMMSEITMEVIGRLINTSEIIVLVLKCYFKNASKIAVIAMSQARSHCQH